MAVRLPSPRSRTSPRPSGIAREVHAGTAAPAQPLSSSATKTARLPKLDVGGPLVLPAVRVDEAHLELAGIGRTEREAEERVLADRLRGVEYGHLLAEVGGDDPGDVVVLLLDDLALRVAL